MVYQTPYGMPHTVYRVFVGGAPASGPLHHCNVRHCLVWGTLFPRTRYLSFFCRWNQVSEYSHLAN